jgi:hypothetical protein
MDKCKKGSGLHWDVVLLCMLNVPGALFGGPWICAATVRAIAHLSALTVMSTTHKPGESPKVVDVKGKVHPEFPKEKSKLVKFSLKRILGQMEKMCFGSIELTEWVD